MRKILLPLDGSPDSLEAVWHVIREARRAGPIEVHLLNVQMHSLDEESMIAIPTEDPDLYYRRRSIKALEYAERSLSDRGIGFRSHRMVGPVAESILQKQKELGCGSIVMSARGRGRLLGTLLGGICSRVMKMAKVPVILVEAPRIPDFTGRLGAT